MAKHNYELNFNRIKEARIKKGMRQQDIFLKTHIQASNLSKYENMQENIPIKQFNKICNCLDISFDYALGLSNKNNYIKKEELDAKVIGERLKEIRLKNNLYQETLAMEIGTSKSLICEYEKGKKLLSLPYAYAICKKYNVSADYLFGKQN